MKKETAKKGISYFLLFYIIGFIIYTFIVRNYEFFYYALFHLAGILLIIKYYKKLNISLIVLIGLLIFEILHTLGGSIIIKENILYQSNLSFLEIYYDNIVHFIASATIVLFFFGIFKKYLKSKLSIFLFSIITALSLGIIVEAIEYLAFILFGTINTYQDTITDLIADLIGGLGAFLIIQVISKNSNKPSPNQ